VKLIFYRTKNRAQLPVTIANGIEIKKKFFAFQHLSQ